VNAIVPFSLLVLSDILGAMKQEAFDYYQKWIDVLPDRDQRMLERDLAKIQSLFSDKKTKIHLIGVCGKGTATLAGLLVDAGYSVSGSDSVFYPPMDKVVENLGIRLFKEYSPENVTDIDVVVVANACSPDHVEVLAARQKNIPLVSMSEVLEFLFLQDRKSVVVAGTHGKTTTTGMISWVLEHMGMDPFCFIGGVINIEKGSSYRYGRGSWAVLEGDEYDTAFFDKGPKFLHYKPHIGIITSCEYDHVTMYPSFTEYQQAFRFFVQEVSIDGLLIVHYSVVELLGLKQQEGFARIMSYGSEKADKYLRNIHQDGSYTSAEIMSSDKGTTSLGTLRLQIPGSFNLENALAAYCALVYGCGLNSAKVLLHLETFPGMERRQQILFDGKILFIDDFAHHPTAVLETLKSLKLKYPGRRLVALFEPRSSSSRKKFFEKGYADALTHADVVFVCAPALRDNDDPRDFVDISSIVEGLRAQDKIAEGFADTKNLLSVLPQILEEGDVVVTMSNASFDGIQEKIVAMLKAPR
jgi:UDP-N-acetylmuramate: L-alanyl-gamma-D-glutamyl-meso-diaminopimelate ligase